MKHLQETLQWGYKISASVISLRIWLYIYEVDLATGLLCMEIKYGNHSWSFIGRISEATFLTLEKRECSGSLGCRSSGSMNGIWNPGSAGKRQTLATLSQRADSVVCCSVKGGGTESSGRNAFLGGVPEVVPPPCLFGSRRFTHLTFLI